MKSCPKCSSNNVKIIDYLGVKCIVCSKCGFDESKQYDVYLGEKGSQKEKGRYSPYRTGGFRRSKR